jgi:hypothetical protein
MAGIIINQYELDEVEDCRLRWVSFKVAVIAVTRVSTLPTPHSLHQVRVGITEPIVMVIRKEGICSASTSLNIQL